MSEVKLHVESLDAFFEQTLSMARRLDQGERVKSGARISFEGMETLLKVLTPNRSEEHTSELQSLMRISYAVFCLKKKKKHNRHKKHITHTNPLTHATRSH